MKILYLSIDSFFANYDMLKALENYTDEGGNKLEICKYDYVYEEAKVRNDADFEAKFERKLLDEAPDFVFSFTFLPVVSKVCNKAEVIYVSWVYDSPELFAYSFQAINKCNIILMFDSAEYEKFVRGGIETVEYLPLAAATDRLEGMSATLRQQEKYSSDISFVGSLYTERGRYYDEIAGKIDPYFKGYIDGVIRSQLQVDGVNFVEKCLTPEVIEGLQKGGNFKPHDDGIETLEYIYSNFVINRRITSIERQELLTLIGKEHELKLYTHDVNSGFTPEGVINMGPVDYYNEMPLVFKLSKINLNFTLRSIQNGIPLRAFDIFGAGGFLLTNYQVDLERHFIPGEDYVYYEDRRDLLNKIDYYLAHDEEREMIAQNAHKKVAESHNFNCRIKEILALVREKKGQ